MILDDFPRLKQTVEDLKRLRDQKIGEKNVLVKRLRKEFGCNSMKEAKALLARLQAKMVAENEAYSKLKRRFDKKWKKKLNSKK